MNSSRTHSSVVPIASFCRRLNLKSSHHWLPHAKHRSICIRRRSPTLQPRCRLSLDTGDDCIPTGGMTDDGDCNIDDCCDMVAECNDDGTCSLPPPACTNETCGQDEECVAGASCIPLDAQVHMNGFGDPTSPYIGILSYGGEDVYLVGEGDASGINNVTEAIIFDQEVDDYLHILFDGGLDRPDKMFLEMDETRLYQFRYNDDGLLLGMVEIGDVGESQRRLTSSIAKDVSTWSMGHPEWQSVMFRAKKDPECEVSWPEKVVRVCRFIPGPIGRVCWFIIIVKEVVDFVKDKCCEGSYCLEDCD